MKLRLGDKIFLILAIIVIGIYIFNGILEDFGQSMYVSDMDPSEFFFGWSIILGLPWAIYRIISMKKSRQKK